MKKKGWGILGVTAAGLLLAPLIVPIFAPWSPINCRHQEINIKTGQARYSRSLWFVTVSERVEDTALSASLRGEAFDVSGIKPWHRVNTFSPGGHHSPHYRFHSALAQVRLLDNAFQRFEVAPEDRQAIAKEVLRLWQTSGNDSEADHLIHEVMGQGVSNKRGAATR